MSPRRAEWFVRAAAAWLLVVSSIKLFLGTPASLPPFFAEGWLGPDLNFRVSIAVELALGAGALIAPRLFALPLAALYVLFVGVLLVLLGQGAESCGCFGGALSFPPALMLAVDAPLLVGTLATRAWRGALERRPPWLALVLSTLAAVAAPAWLVSSGGDGVADATDRPRYVVLDPPAWVGKPITESGLAPWLDVTALSGDARWILYRVDCDHCRDVLRELERKFADDPQLYVLVALRERGDEERRIVDVLPPGEQAALPDDILWHVTPPWELVLENGVVLEANDLRSADGR